MNNDTNTVHWTGDYAEKAECLFSLEKALDSNDNSTQDYINNNNTTCSK
jgi:hypothetical protein